MSHREASCCRSRAGVDPSRRNHGYLWSTRADGVDCDKTHYPVLGASAIRGDRSHGPFLALIEDWFPRGVFGKHPHRGIETVTYVVEGRIDHYDNQGHKGTILQATCNG